MKKFLALLVAVIFSISVKAQCTVTEAVDFTATSCYGEEIHLFDILDGGQYVVIDFFFASSSPCRELAPVYCEAYTRLGCNENEVFFIKVSDRDNDAVCQMWCDTIGIEYPVIGGFSGGSQIHADYGISACPTTILIAPDREVVLQDIWPIDNSQTIVDALEPYGIEEHECGAAAEASVEIAVGEVTDTTIEATFTPNAECASYYILIGIGAEMEQWMAVMGATLEQLVQQWGLEVTGPATHTWDGMVPGTEYTIYALPLDADGNTYEVSSTTATTGTSGGSGVAVIDIEVEVLSETSVLTIATPNEETASYHYGLIEKAYFDEIGEEAAVELIRNDGYEVYEVDEWTWSDLVPNTEYFALSTGQNANGEWGETTMVPFITSLDGCAELVANAFSIHPNPASSMIYLETEMRGEAEVSIIDVVGRNVMKVNVSEISNASINIESLNEGVYFLKIQAGDKYSVEKMIVK